MPQMNPMNWINLFFMFMLIFMLFNIKNYYLFNLKIKHKLMNKINKMKFINWKW